MDDDPDGLPVLIRLLPTALGIPFDAIAQRQSEHQDEWNIHDYLAGKPNQDTPAQPVGKIEQPSPPVSLADEEDPKNCTGRREDLRPDLRVTEGKAN